MEDDVDEMHDTALKLEAAEIKLIQKANKAHNRNDNGKHHSDSASSGEASTHWARHETNTSIEAFDR
jgi:hypothetical protein